MLQRFVIQVKGQGEQLSPGTELRQTMYLCETQQEAVSYGAALWDVPESMIEAVAT